MQYHSKTMIGVSFVLLSMIICVFSSVFYASSLLFSPGTGTFTQNCPFEIDVIVDTPATNSIDLKIFDPVGASITIVPDTSVFGVGVIQPGAMAKFGGQPYRYSLHSMTDDSIVVGRHRLARVEVVPDPAETSVSLSLYAVNNYALDDSNVSFVDSGIITDTLTTRNDGYYTLEVGECDHGSGGDYEDDCPDGDFSGSDYDGRCEADDDGDDDSDEGDGGDDGDICPYGDLSGDPDDGTCDDGDILSDIVDEIDEMIGSFGDDAVCYYKDINYREIFFRDVATHPHKEEINLLLNNCIVQGVDPDNYDPYRAMTRAEFIKILEKLTHIGDRSDFPGEYRDTSDVLTDMNYHWGLVYGLRSYTRGIIPAGNFLPNDVVTFGQAQSWWEDSLVSEGQFQPQWLRDLVSENNADWTLSRGLAAFYFVDLYGDELLDIDHITDHKRMREEVRDIIEDMSISQQRAYLIALYNQIHEESDEEVMRTYSIDRDQFLDEIDRVLLR